MGALAYFDSAAFAALARLVARYPVAVLLSPGSLIRRAADLMQVPFFLDATAAGEAAVAAAARTPT